jgi:tellurite resistance protein
MWAVMFTIIMNRIVFHNPLPQKLMPTLFILIAPPAVALISLTILNN